MITPETQTKQVILEIYDAMAGRYQGSGVFTQVGRHAPLPDKYAETGAKTPLILLLTLAW